MVFGGLVSSEIGKSIRSQTSKRLCVAFVGVALCAGCSTVYKGRVIDVDTKAPIDGVVVVAAWYEETTYVGSTHSRIVDVKETMTDSTGYWEISGLRGSEENAFLAISTLITGTYYTQKPYFTVFKPGYCPSSYRMTRPCNVNIKIYASDDGLMIYELPKFKNEKERRESIPHYISGESKTSDKQLYIKQQHFLEFIDNERKYFNLEPLDVGVEYDK